MSQEAPATVRGGSMLGSGLSVPSYGAILLGSVLLFVLYGGPLWAVPRGSHGMRFAVSYLTVIPVVGGWLAMTRRFSWHYLATAVGTMWALKLLITAPLYYALAPGGALQDIGALPKVRATSTKPVAATSAAASYEPAIGQVATGKIRGKVTRGAIPAAGLVVMVEAPRPGLPLEGKQELTVELTEEGFARGLYLMSTADSVRIRNTGKHMHTARVMGNGRTRLNAPVPPGGETGALSIEESGELEVHCATHPAERAALIVVNHPYAVVTDAEGAFEIVDVPVGAATVVALDATGGKLRRLGKSAEVTKGESVRVKLALPK